MLDPSFNKNVKRIIDILKFPVYIVHIDKDISCICNSTNANEGNVDCPLCLGLGHKIKIYKAKAAIDIEDGLAKSSVGKTKIVTMSYYFNAEDVTHGISYGDLIVRDSDVDLVQTVKKYRSDSNKIIYYACLTTVKKNNRDAFIEHFQKIVKD